MICLILLFGFLLFPSPQLAQQFPIVSFLFKLADKLIQPLLYSKGPKVVSAAPQRKEKLADRLSNVTRIRISPAKLVVYQDDSLIFTALPLDSFDRTIQGVAFTWESSDPDKAQIDSMGRARFLQPGLARIICHAGTSQGTAYVLVKPGRKPAQTDNEWRRDQSSLTAEGKVIGSLDDPDSNNQLRVPSGTKLVGVAYRSENSGKNTTAKVNEITEAAASARIKTWESSGGNTLTRAASRKLSITAAPFYPQDGYTGADAAYDELCTDPKNLVGSPRNRIIEPTSMGGVLPEGSNLNMAVPLVNLPGRGVNVNLTLYYNSRVWGRRASTVTFDPVASWPSPGFSLGFGRIVTYDTIYNGPYGVQRTKYMLIDPDGTRHYLGQSTLGDYYGIINGETTDGYHISFGCSWNFASIKYNDGTSVYFARINNRLLPNWIQDTNGNYITITYKDASEQSDENGYAFTYPPNAIDYITDTLGRVVQFNYTTNTGVRQLVSITAPGFDGTSQNPVTRTVAEFQFENRTVSNSFSGLTVQNVPYSFSALRRIHFPATDTGYLFSYSAYGMIYNYSARRQMSTGDGIDTASVNFNYPINASSLTDVPTFTQRTESAVNSPTGTYYYTRVYYTNEVHIVVQRPDTTQLFFSRFTDTATVGKGLIYFSKLRLADWATERASTVFSYVNDGGGSPQIQSVTSTITNDDSTINQTLAWFGYDQYGNVVNKWEYGNQSGGQWVVRRRTRFVYKSDTAYISAGIKNRVVEADVYDALGNTNDADDVLMARATQTYDDYQAMGGMEEYTSQPSPPGHTGIIGTTTVRGNTTGVTKWIDITANTSITRLAKYDKFGNIVKAQISCCQEKTFSHSEDNYWSDPDQVTSGSGSPGSLTDISDQDFNTSLLKSQKDPRDKTTTFGYDAALMPNSATLPTGAAANANMNYANLSSSSSVTYDDDGTQKTLTKSEQYDGWVRAIQSVDTNGVQVNTSYDAMGRVASRTNPFAVGGLPGASTTYQYDALGRATVVTLPGGNTIQTSYSGSSITVTDQVGRKIKRETDGLGRLVKVTEQDSLGALTQETTYSYNVLDKLMGVNQGNQIRAFKYDALGRLIYEKIPEQSATINEAGGTWTTKYTYTDFDAVATRQDARGVITTYGYDTMHRLTSISYNTTNAPGVAATTGINYTYDNGDTSPTKGLLLNMYGGFYQTNSYDSHNRLSSVQQTIGTRTYTVSYQYNQASQIKQITYPSGNVVNLSYDSKGRLSSTPYDPQTPWLGGYLNSVSYNAISQASGVSLGNGVVESYGYDTNRLQMTMHTATKGGNTLMSLTYNYTAAAGQSGQNSTLGNVGQLMTISGTINGQTESAAYTYDLQGRLVTSNQTSNGASAQRRFVYDRWGNRTGVWDAVTGGNQIQSITLQQSGGAPINRITSVTTGSTLNYSYDAAGNVTNDGAHSYTYDAENRVVSVDGGATAQYVYDYQNRRILKQAGSSITHYVWQGSKVIAEHNGSTGTELVRYIYAGSRMIAKVEGGITRYFLSDRLSTRVVLDGSGNVVGRQAHLPFGEDFAGGGSQQKQHFTSYERDNEAGTDYAINRQYVQSVGKFNRVDPLGKSANKDNPQTWNRYAYAGSDPVNMKDPWGLFACPGCVDSGGVFDPCGPFGATVIADGLGLTSNPFCIETLPVPETAEFVSGSAKPCEAAQGFTQEIRGYSAEELNNAMITVFGELTSQLHLLMLTEAIAIGSIIFNRSDRLKTGDVPPNSNWGENGSLSEVVSARGQFAGFAQGKKLLKSGLELNEGERNCTRLTYAYDAIELLALGVPPRFIFLYMCARGALHRDVDSSRGEEQIGKNVFSPSPFGVRNQDCY